MTDDYIFRPATEADVEDLAPRLKQDDVNEIWAYSRQRPLGALQHSLLSSHESFACEYKGTVEMMFGIAAATTLSNYAMPWLLSSDEVYNPIHTRTFVKGSMKWVEMAKFMYPRQKNWVDARNKRTVKWLKFLGYTMDDPEPMGRDELPFHLFHYGMDI